MSSGQVPLKEDKMTISQDNGGRLENSLAEKLRSPKKEQVETGQSSKGSGGGLLYTVAWVGEAGKRNTVRG